MKDVSDIEENVTVLEFQLINKRERDQCVELIMLLWEWIGGRSRLKASKLHT